MTCTQIINFAVTNLVVNNKSDTLQDVGISASVAIAQGLRSLAAPTLQMGVFEENTSRTPGMHWVNINKVPIIKC